MNKETLTTYLKTVRMRHDNKDKFWADLMNETKGQIAGWLVEAKINHMNQLIPFLRPSQISAISEEIDNG